MPSRNFAIGATSIPALQALLGQVTAVSLITAASGTVQNGYKAPTDLIVITAANAGNNAVTLFDPFLLGYGVGDFYEVVNATAQACVVFPPTGGNINAAGANASVALAAQKSMRIYVTAVAAGASTFNTLTGA